MLQASNSFINLLKSKRPKQMFIKIEIFDSKFKFVREITRSVMNDIGQISVARDRAIRRSISLTLDNSKEEFTWSENSLIWIDKRLKIYVGLKLPNGTIEYIPQGVFILTEPEDSHSANGKLVTINAVDQGYLLSDKRGKLINELTIETGAKVTDVIKIVAQKAGISQFNFDVTNATVPYTLTYQGDQTAWDVISELAILAKCEVYFDEHGYLKLKNIDLNEFSKYPPVWSFNVGDVFYAGNSRKFDDAELFNHIITLGGSSQTATCRYELIVDETNPMWINNPYSIQKIGRITYFHNNGSPDGLLTSNEECKWRSKYELMRKLGYAENVSITSLPHFLLDAGDIIELNDYNLAGRYLIDSISIPLRPDMMTLQVKKQRLFIDNWDFI